MILITGSDGLIGSALGAIFDRDSIEWRGFDIRRDGAEDTRDPQALARAMEGVDGVVHLAAVSRVVWAQNDPQTTQDTNVGALDELLRLAGSAAKRPWVIFASSREVYGQQDSLPVKEDAPLLPMNTYARSKVAGEQLIEAAREQGLLAQTVRFSNVYGSVDDYSDRVTPAFARTAVTGGTVRVDGSDHTFDFTQVDDAARGLDLLVQATRAGELLPPIQLLTGTGTTLGELAALASDHARRPVTLVDAPPRTYDVEKFVGDPARARELLGWTAQVPLAEGFARLVEDFAAADLSTVGLNTAGLPIASKDRATAS